VKSATERLHPILLTLFAAVFGLAIWGLAHRSSPGAVHPGLVLWTAIGAISAIGAILEMIIHQQVNRSLSRMQGQIDRMSREAGTVHAVVADHPAVEGLATMLNHYLSKVQDEIDQQTRQKRELDLLVAAIQAEKDNTEAVIRNISDAVLVFDAMGQLLLANHSAETLLGFSASECRQRSAEDFLEQDRLCNLVSQLRSGANGESALQAEVWLSDRVEASPGRCFDVTANAVRFAGDQPWAIVLVLHDITRVRELDEMKNEFINHVTHELRAPLSSIRAYVDVLIDDELKLADQRKDFYRIIEAEAIRLEGFIDNILNFNRMESGLMPFVPMTVDVSAKIRGVAELMAFQAREKEIALSVEVAEGVTAAGDRDLLRLALVNLVSNAIKYTPQGGWVKISAEADHEANVCRIRVSDNGIGIAPADQGRVFEKFYRSSDGQHVARGTGLGLPLPRRIVEEFHHGRIEVHSAVKEGTTFVVSLPIVADRSVSDGVSANDRACGDEPAVAIASADA